jgi:hypothetical protein
MTTQTELEQARQIRQNAAQGKINMADAVWMNEKGNELLFNNGELERVVNPDTGDWYYYPKQKQLTSYERRQKIAQATKVNDAEDERKREEKING